jgi:flagellar hook-associated protein 1
VFPKFGNQAQDTEAEHLIMGSLFTSLYTGASGIFVNQTGVQVTGNNIANVNTAGYSKQTANVTSSTSLNQGGLIFGTGSTIATIDRAGDVFITEQLVNQSAIYGEYEAANTPLSDIEQILDISDSSLSSDVDNFFNAWETLSSNPAGTTERQQVIQEAEDLADHFHSIDQQLTDVVESINSSIESLVPSLNEQLQQVGELNQSIMQTEVTGNSANTLRDQRDLLVQQVSESCGATIYSDGNGMTCMQLDNGLPLVTGSVASTFSVDRIDGLAQLTLTSGQSEFSLDGDDFGGTLKGLLDVRDETIPEIKDNIDQLAYEIATAVNTLHTTGLDQNGDPGTDLYTLVAPSDPLAPVWEGAAASITLNFDNPALIAAGTTGLSGDNSLTLNITALRDTASINGSTYSEEYARIAAKAGLLMSSNEQKLSDSTGLLNELSNKQDSIAGVSTDEEMLLLVQYQAGYEAASNYLAVVKEMLETLMQI